jgi:hypothetical protein
MPKKWSTQIVDFYNKTVLQTALPNGVQALYPYRDNPSIQRMVKTFYTKYYGDKMERELILGINPGRLGAGATGIPFTDTKRLIDVCGIPSSGLHTHEPSSVFVYDVIDAFGGAENFYNRFYISSICPIGFVKVEGSRSVNFNYYDDKAFAERLMLEVAELLQQQINWGLRTDRVVVFGTGKNLDYVREVNKRYGFFKTIVPLEHPRFIMQYKLRQKETYIDKYLQALLSQ